jgi:hypothetical protein
MNKLKGYAPDLPTTEVGIIVDCSKWIPYESGMRAADAAASYSDALAAACRGAASITLLDSSRRVFAGTATKLYELASTSWSDVSAVGDYSLGSDSRWYFTQFGDTSLASTIDETIQFSTSSGDFADISGAPKAAIVESVLSSGGGFVIAFNTIDGTYGTRPDAWWCCAVNDQTTWTPSVAVQCATGRLLGYEGKVTAAKKFGGDRIIAYKSQSLYMGQYVGPPGVWSWNELPGYGCVGMDAVANLGTAHFVVGEDEIYIFDGVRPTPIAKDVRQWFLSNSSGTYRYRTIVVYDRDADLIRIFFPSTGSSTGTPDTCLVYHLRTGQWGRDDHTIEAALIFNTPTTTFDADSGTFDGGASGTFDEIPPGNKVVAIFNSSHVLQTLDGTPGASSFTLHDIGDDSEISRLTEARLRYMQQPSSASLAAFYSMATGGSVTTGPTQSAYDVPSNGSNVFPIRQTGRWHRLKFNFTGDCKVIGYRVKQSSAGKR